ncbi:MAG: hypothetical protein J6Y17_00245 [Elusimicrobiaceae bacterium]|nr:hypothetical protein [Elusimicrobiaceae bacterium]
MKATLCKIIGLVLVSTVCVPVAFAVPWAEEEDYDPHLLNKALDRGLNIEVSGVDADQKMAYRKAASQAYNTWFKESANAIEAQGRQQEFGALYTRLAQGVNTNRLGANPDVKVVIVSPEQLKKTCNIESQGCATINTVPPTIYMPPKTAQNEQAWNSTLLHEVGHTLGLDEQYDRAGSHNQDVSRVRSSSERHTASIMNNNDNRHLTCDDATGLINIIDHHASGKYNRQGKQWNSLCNDSKDKYKDGKRVGAEQQTHIVRNSGSNRWEMQRPGSAKQNYEIAKNSPIRSVQDVINMPITVTKKDEQGRPLEGKGKYGEKVVYSYFQGQTNRMAFLGNNLIWADQATKRDGQTDHIVQFGHNGKVAQAFWGQLNDGTDKAIIAGYKADTYDQHQDYDKIFECPPTLSVEECLTKNIPTNQPAASKPQEAPTNTRSVNGQNTRVSSKQEQTRPNTTRARPAGNTPAPRSQAHPVKQDQRKPDRNSGVVRPASTRGSARGTTPISPSQNKVVGSAYYL